MTQEQRGENELIVWKAGEKTVIASQPIVLGEDHVFFVGGISGSRLCHALSNIKKWPDWTH